MNLFNMIGTGNDLQNGAFVTLNGRQWKESLENLVQAIKEANNIDITKKGTLLAWLSGNFNTDYDFVKNFQADSKALEDFIGKYKNKNNKQYYGKKDDAFKAALQNSSAILQDFVKNADDAKISVTEFFKSVTGAGALESTLKSVGLQMLVTAGQAAAIWAVSEAIRFVATKLDELARAGEIAREKMDESTNAYKGTADEVSSLNDELSENNERITEIKAQGTITYTEQQELEKLQTANDKLERQIQLKEYLAEMQAKEAVNDAVDSFNKNYGADYFGEDFDLNKNGPRKFIDYEDLFNKISPYSFAEKILGRSNDIREYSAAIDYLNEKIDDYNQKAQVAATTNEEQTWLKQAELYQTQLDKINQGILDQANDLETYKDTLDIIGFDNLTTAQKQMYNQIQEALKYNYMQTDPAGWFEKNFNSSKYTDTVTWLKDNSEEAAKALTDFKNKTDETGVSLKEFFATTNDNDLSV